ncbi:Gag-like protein [Operophtera brumata]|uniref:Gag-like protein n=1 Tax=Operophtera brumata TaxID=104452 RepID=A0A0L7LLF7_OPEBR|nr:Gag-like protein [Operophtera brumata]
MAVDMLHKRSSTDVTKELQADNTRLQGEIADLRREMAELREEVSQAQRNPPPPSPRRPSPERMEVPETLLTQGGGQLEELTRSIMLQVGSMVSARLETLEEHLLPEKRIRPPLAADRKIRQETSEPTTSDRIVERLMPEKRIRPVLLDDKRETVQAVETAALNPSEKVEQIASQSKKRKNKMEQGGTGKPMASQSDLNDLPRAPANTSEGWTTVVKRSNNKMKIGSQTTTVKSGSDKPKSRPSAKTIKLRTPRTAAVVITLQPDAEVKGTTYADVLTQAKEKIDLNSCGITSLRFRKAATGARILEVVAGDASDEKADFLALKLKEALNEELARVSRPTKCAGLRILGLDDSVSKEDVVAAIALRGCCSKETIKVGEIKCSYQGTGITTSAVSRHLCMASVDQVADHNVLQNSTVSIENNLLPCNKCSQIRFLKGIRGLKIHDSKVHQQHTNNVNSSTTLHLPSSNITHGASSSSSEQFWQKLSYCKQNVPVIKRIPRGARVSVAQSLTTDIKAAIAQNSESTWEHLLTWPYRILHVPDNPNDKTSLTAKIKRNCYNL